MAAILKKGQFRNPPASLPRPLLRAGNQPRQGESIPPDKLFRPASSALVVLIIWILPEIVSNFVQQTPPSFTFSEIERGCLSSKCPGMVFFDIFEGIFEIARERAVGNTGVRTSFEQH